MREVCQTHYPESHLRTAGMPRRTCEGALKCNNPSLYQVPLSSLSLSTILDKGTLSASTPFQHTVEHRGKVRKGGTPKREKRVHTLKEGGPPRRFQGVRAGKHPNPV